MVKEINETNSDKRSRQVFMLDHFFLFFFFGGIIKIYKITKYKNIYNKYSITDRTRSLLTLCT